MLVIDSLSVTYGQGLALSNANLDVTAGSVVCLMGRNGVGKTTLMKTVMGLLKVSTGNITFDEKKITNWPPHKRAKVGIGYVPQGRHIFPYLNIQDNLIMGLEACMSKPNRNVALNEVYTMFPGLKEHRSKPAGVLSGGQQQQLALARVLIRQPRLLLLDEPTEGLQPSIIQEIEDLIINLKEQNGMSILLVEQSLDFAMTVSDHCFLMEKGEIVLEGPTVTLDQNLMRRYLSV